MRFFATAARGIEPLLASEITSLVGNATADSGGVHFEGQLQDAYRVCLWSRLASRVLYPLHTFDAADPEALYEGVRGVRWDEHLLVQGSLAIDFTSVHSQLTHTQFGAQKAKDAIVDQFRDQTGQRPNVDRDAPDVRVNVHVQRDVASVGIDLSGEPLHRRGYRLAIGRAPLKETLAAAILARTRWAQVCAEGGSFVDPMCGSGTFIIEAAMMAYDHAPGLMRPTFGFSRWLMHQPDIWQALLEEAQARAIEGDKRVVRIVGYDIDGPAVLSALQNAERAKVKVHIETRAIERAEPAGEHGVLVVNPPYGERIGDEQELKSLYQRLGDVLKQRFSGWTAYVLTTDEWASELRLRADKRHTFYNGALIVKLLTIPLHGGPLSEGRISAGTREPTPPDAASFSTPKVLLTENADAFGNRLKKNLKKLEPWRKRHDVHAYRAYDADIPEYAVAVDVFDTNKGLMAHVQEYAPPKDIDPSRARARLTDVEVKTAEMLGIDAEAVHLKVRQRQKGIAQYEKQDEAREFLVVREGGLQFWVNLKDYLDTGLFLDHRKTRSYVRDLSRGKRFLNLFCYTASVSVYAAAGGAKQTTSVDMSATYLDWGRENLLKNGFSGEAHRLIQADCLQWMERSTDRFDVIFCDPPTFSNSKRMQETWDVQRDHVWLIRQCVALLAPGGTLIFSTNHQKFKLDEAALAPMVFSDLSAQTLPEDFERRPKIHRCFRYDAP